MLFVVATLGNYINVIVSLFYISLPQRCAQTLAEDGGYVHTHYYYSVGFVNVSTALYPNICRNITVTYNFIKII